MRWIREFHAFALQQHGITDETRDMRSRSVSRHPRNDWIAVHGPNQPYHCCKDRN